MTSDFILGTGTWTDSSIPYLDLRVPCDAVPGSVDEEVWPIPQVNTGLVNHPVPSPTEPSTSLVRVGTVCVACKSITNSILRYKDCDSHKNAHKDFQKRFIDNRSIDTCVQFMQENGLDMI
ncbi:uncharacterized protein TNCV_3533911 [Trichonephila clavipes]|nr:uncharacterized protein TNCV_3533911 [Trichonephila clavipes]